MANTLLRIATRQSPLALWQANYVRERLQQIHPGLQVELVTLVTRGDVLLDTPLAKIGGKGLFVKELERAMLNGQADLAVHSMKDVPMELPDGLTLTTICQREDPHDAFVSTQYQSLEQLPLGSVVGTSSLRRQCQIARLRGDLQIRVLRGNVGTRLARLDNGEYDAIILAAAGLKRLGLHGRIASLLPTQTLLPAGGQGAVGIECRTEDKALHALLAPLHHAPTADCVTAERAVNQRLQGGCQVPIACYAQWDQSQLWLRALVGSIDGKTLIHGQRRGTPDKAAQMGRELADELLNGGARQILAQIQGAGS